MCNIDIAVDAVDGLKVEKSSNEKMVERLKAYATVLAESEKCQKIQGGVTANGFQ